MAHNIFVPRFRPKTNSFRLLYQRHSSSVDSARELFKGSNGSASLLVRTRKKFFGCGLLISQTLLLLQIITFEPKTPAGHPKYQKTETWIVA